MTVEDFVAVLGSSPWISSDVLILATSTVWKAEKVSLLVFDASSMIHQMVLFSSAILNSFIVEEESLLGIVLP